MHTPDSVIDLTHLSSVDQYQMLHSKEEQTRLSGTIDDNIYILRGNIDEVLGSLGQVRLGLHDIDGTHTTVGGHRLHEPNVRGLKKLSETRVKNIAVTGRHQGQVEEVLENHPEGTSIDSWLLEQGFFLRTGRFESELFEGREEIANRVVLVRELVSATLKQLEVAHGINFETTSLRNGKQELYPHAHKTMYSVDAHRNGMKISDPGLHEAVLTTLTKFWQGIDANGAIAHNGTSSIGTYEWTPDGLNKEGAVRRVLVDERVPAEQAMYLGDSGNDRVVFEHIPGLVTGAIVNPHTNESLIRHARIATVGTANAAPILTYATQARLAARRIVIPMLRPAQVQ